ncbi:hypothetical protein SPOG_05609 [Schizosaccharomyces cryophilus OY26]|uniref:Uncharacterized protein n=1 Tax=Schizosaccharomyces cryophilus (strain OY26 / ATCC MYA-4695 / CBS 11777 / NBRC 106824 / NRRL Y48691) TaxID=653667 RepID=S9WWR9_SCHCR|nr:uncharacterized protein SPOG_05609 [Schizosaccharomyces cryophilus OY26]EPY49187.1 hypothetical protein SPOG_05609 [Schizosaccharomyces cryophilus OY26]
MIVSFNSLYYHYAIEEAGFLPVPLAIQKGIFNPSPSCNISFRMYYSPWQNIFSSDFLKSYYNKFICFFAFYP